jgi:hypothetical protein
VTSENHMNALEALQSLEDEQRERYRPAPAAETPATPAEQYLRKLNASLSTTISVDSGWLR